MIVIFTGSRKGAPPDLIRAHVKRFAEDSKDWTVFEGGAKGVDTQVKIECEYFGVSYVTFPANWKSLGKKAGPIRNKTMLDYAMKIEPLQNICAIGFPASDSRGTKHMLKIARQAGVHTEEYPI